MMAQIKVVLVEVDILKKLLENVFIKLSHMKGKKNYLVESNALNCEP